MLTRRHLLACSAVTGLLLALPFSPAAAQGGSQATAFVVRLGDALVSIIDGPGSYEEKKTRLEPLIEQSVAVDSIARFCLGRYWNQAGPQQHAEYTRLFHQVLMNNIFGKIGEFQGVTFTPTTTQQRGEEALVGTLIKRPNQQANNVQWVVAPVGGQMKIVDVIAEGTSLRLTQRADYASYLQRNGGNVGALITAMRGQLSR